MSEETHQLIQHRTPRCLYCGNTGIVVANRRGVMRWEAGELIQKALPELSAEHREQMISGFHPECFDKAFDA